MKTIHLFEVGESGIDGRAPYNVIAFFEKEADALKLKTPWTEVRSTELRIYTSHQDYQDNNPDALRAKALAKLTPEDMKVLGLHHR